MNAEVIKAMNKKETKVNVIRKWWNKNGDKVMIVILFPLWLGIKAEEKITSYLNSREKWSEERAHEILSYCIPRNAEWDAEDKTFYFTDNGLVWGSKHLQKKIKLSDRRWWRKYACGCGGRVRTYLIEKFELEGFEKIVGDTSECWTEISFRMIEK